MVGKARPCRVQGRRRRISLAGILATAFVLAIGFSSSAQAYVYWTNDDDTMGRANLDGTGANQSFITGVGFATGMAVDRQHVYWSNNYAGTIGRANLDGTSVNRSFITSGGGPIGVAVDGHHLYWPNFTDNTIGRANLDGTDANESFITGASSPYAVATDGQHVYWTNSSGSAIGRADLDGQNVDQSFITSDGPPLGVALDGQHVYWTNRADNTIGRADLDGNNVNQSFISGTSFPGGIAVDARHVYWSNNYAGTIGRAELDGTGVNQSFIASDGTPLAVAVDALPVVPRPTISSRPRRYSNQTDASFAFASTDINATYKCRLDSLPLRSCGSGQSYSGLGEGDHRFAVRAYDGGNVSTATGWKWTVDTVAPTVQIDSGPSGTVNQDSAVFEFSSNDPDARFRCRLAGGAVQTCTSPRSYSGLADGAHRFLVRAVDRAGNSSAVAVRNWTVAP
jgi:virginiamycin B lyase